ncbi:MAG: hypothetical protein V4691_09745 [Pseudomonadota bacterium]
MIEEFGNFSKWSYKKLVDKERSFSSTDLRGTELRAEINRRDKLWNKRVVLISTIAAILAALATLGLDRGIYVGHAVQSHEGVLSKSCSYLFVTGIAKIPAHGGLADQGMPGIAKGMQLADQPDNLYCRFFAE